MYEFCSDAAAHVLTATEKTADTFWWSRSDLCWHDEKLLFAGRVVEDLARQFGTPTFFYSSARVKENVNRLRHAFKNAGLGERCRINFAMKANRFSPLLAFLKQSGLVGIDACSPNEVEHAISCGFNASEVSFTGTSLSRQDIDRLARIYGLRVNCDSIHLIEHWGRRLPGSRIGIRVNPACGISRSDNEKLQYAGESTTKFGIYREQFAEALKMAEKYQLTVDTIHFHTGCGYLTPQLGILERIIEKCSWFIDQVPTLKFVNIGGGLGVPHVESDEPLDLTRWANILADNFGEQVSGIRSGLTIEVEPGDYIAKDAGILLLTVGSVETKRNTVFVGVNGGFNLAVEPAVYGLPFQPVPAILRKGAHASYSIAGHINEALDLWYRDIELPPLVEDDTLVLLNAGAYSSSMASNHCMRGDFREFLIN